MHMFSDDAHSSTQGRELRKRLQTNASHLPYATGHFVTYSLCLLSLLMTSWGWDSGNTGGFLCITSLGDLESHFLFLAVASPTIYRSGMRLPANVLGTLTEDK